MGQANLSEGLGKADRRRGHGVELSPKSVVSAIRAAGSDRGRRFRSVLRSGGIVTARFCFTSRVS
jgi:hypothetical protein